MASMGTMPMAMGPDHGPATKRLRTTSAPAAFAPRVHAFAQVEEAKLDLVARVKAFQRSGDECKEQWWTHCDQQLGGIRDPARHDTDTLQNFCEEFGVP